MNTTTEGGRVLPFRVFIEMRGKRSAAAGGGTRRQLQETLRRWASEIHGSPSALAAREIWTHFAAVEPPQTLVEELVYAAARSVINDRVLQHGEWSAAADWLRPNRVATQA
jgi:hypothetical protein